MRYRDMKVIDLLTAGVVYPARFNISYILLLSDRERASLSISLFIINSIQSLVCLIAKHKGRLEGLLCLG